MLKTLSSPYLALRSREHLKTPPNLTSSPNRQVLRTQLSIGLGKIIRFVGLKGNIKSTVDRLEKIYFFPFYSSRDFGSSSIFSSRKGTKVG